MENKPKPIFNKRIFWDAILENIDYDAKADLVIEWAFERGDVDDIRNCRRYYGDDKVREVLLNTHYLSGRRLYLASAVVDRPVTDFKSYKPRNKMKSSAI